MSAISAALKIFGSIIFVLFLGGFIGANALAQFTSHDNLQPALVGALTQQLPTMTADDFSRANATLQLICRQPGRESVNLADVFQGSTDVTVNCSDIVSMSSSQDLMHAVAVSMSDQIYYKQYSCDFISCVMQLQGQDKAFVIISAHANSFFNQAVMLSAVGMILGLALMVFAIRNVFGILKAVGIEMIVTGGLAYAGLMAVKGMVPTTGIAALSQLIGGLLSTMSDGYVVVLIIGIILAVSGFVGVHFVKHAKTVKEKSAKAKPAKTKKKR